MDDDAEALGAGGARVPALALEEPAQRTGADALDVGGADADGLSGLDERRVRGGAGDPVPGGRVGGGDAGGGEEGEGLGCGGPACSSGVVGVIEGPGDGGAAELADEPAQGEVADVGGGDDGAVLVEEGRPGGAGDLEEEGRGGVVLVLGGGDDEPTRRTGEGGQEHAALVGSNLGARGSGVELAGRGAVSPEREPAGDGVDEQPGASERVAQTEVRPGVAAQTHDGDDLPLATGRGGRGEDGDAVGAHALGRDGVGGEDLLGELGEEVGGVGAGVALGPDLGALEEGGDDVEVPFGGLGEEGVGVGGSAAEGGGAPGPGATGGVPGGPEELLGVDASRRARLGRVRVAGTGL